MMRRLVLIFILLILLLMSCSRDPESAVEGRISRIENGLLRDYADPFWKRMSLAERMTHHNVPGVSIAVINDYQVEWAKGYGVLEAGSEELVNPDTLFQAASIAKPVIAAALDHVERGALDLDADISQRLVSWQIPENQFTTSEKVTLRRLLSHAAGVTVHGFVGYARGEKLPSLQQILNGEPPANSAPIRVDAVPGEQLRYSGGGYMIVQQLLEDVTGKPFAEVMQDTVLDPLSIPASAFAPVLQENRWANAASGHFANGQVIPGKWHAYPLRGQGVIIMSNGDGGDFLWREILNSVSVEYGLVANHLNLYLFVVAATIFVGVALLIFKMRRRSPAIRC